MNDRDSLMDLFEIVSFAAKERGLELTLITLDAVHKNYGGSYDEYYRRRLSVARMLIGLHLPMDNEKLDVILAATLCNYYMADHLPDEMILDADALFGDRPQLTEIKDILALLHRANDINEDTLSVLGDSPNALLIRLAERGTLVEALYEFPTGMARSFIRDTREHFFDLCIHAKENYPELIGPASILTEKTRNLILANETMLDKYEALENSLKLEILSLKEENATLRSIIARG